MQDFSTKRFELPAAGTALPHDGSRAAIARSQSRSFLFYAARPMFWFNCGLFFVAATPFELERSGFSYLIRLCCIALLLATTGLVGRIRLPSPHPLAVLVVLALLFTNITAPADRLVLGITIIIISCSLGRILSTKWLNEFTHILGVYLAVNVLGLIVQMAFLFGAGVPLDLHGLIFPNASRIEIFSDFSRLSSLHNEPGTYSQWMLMALFLRSLITKKMISLFNVGVCLSIVATVSLWGIVGAAIYFLTASSDFISSSHSSVRTKKIYTSVIVALTSFFLALQMIPEYSIDESSKFLLNKAGMVTDSGQDKLLAISEIEQKFSTVIIFGEPMVPGFCPYCIAPNDIGIWANGIYYFGFILMFALVATLAWRLVRHWGFQVLPMLVMMLSWKAPFYDPLLWVLIGHILGSGPIKSLVRAARA